MERKFLTYYNSQAILFAYFVLYTSHLTIRTQEGDPGPILQGSGNRPAWPMKRAGDPGVSDSKPGPFALPSGQDTVNGFVFPHFCPIFLRGGDVLRGVSFRFSRVGHAATVRP